MKPSPKEQAVPQPWRDEHTPLRSAPRSYLGAPWPTREQTEQQEKLVLTTKRVVSRRRISPSIAESMKITVYKDQDPLTIMERAVDELVAELEAYVFTQVLAKDQIPVEFTEVVEAEHWATWWDQFKAEEVAPLRLWGWMARRWPPKTVVIRTVVRGSKVVHLTREAMFPEANYLIPPEKWFGRPVLVESHEVWDSDQAVRVTSGRVDL